MRIWAIALVCIVAMLVVGGLEVYALYLGHNGMLLAGAVAAVVGVPAVLITKKVVESKVKKDG